MAFVAVVLVVGYAAFVVALPFLIYRPERMLPPWWFYRPIGLFGLFTVPAVVVLIGVALGNRLLLVVGGVLCLLQSFIAFSGVTFGFLVAAAVLLRIGSLSEPGGGRLGTRGALAGFAIVALAVGAWVAFLGLTEPRCWVGSPRADGATEVVEVPASEAERNGPGPVAPFGEGCGSAEITIRGLGLAAALSIAAIAAAARAPGAVPGGESA
jgi:hypothetical protein